MTQPGPRLNTKCPICTQELEDVSQREGLSEMAAPYVCRTDARAFWPEELTAPARAMFRKELRDFGDTPAGFKMAQDIVKKRQAERLAKRKAK